MEISSLTHLVSEITNSLFCAFAGFIALSTYPELTQRIKVFFALAPVATGTYGTSLLTTLVRLPQAVIKVCHSTFWHMIVCFVSTGFTPSELSTDVMSSERLQCIRLLTVLVDFRLFAELSCKAWQGISSAITLKWQAYLHHYMFKSNSFEECPQIPEWI